jgi:hypothetical protein
VSCFAAPESRTSKLICGGVGGCENERQGFQSIPRDQQHSDDLCGATYVGTNAVYYWKMVVAGGAKQKYLEMTR